MKRKLGAFFLVSRAAYWRLSVVGGGSAGCDSIRALSNRSNRIADVGPVNVWSHIFDANLTARRLFNLDCHRLTAATLAVDDLPEICDRGSDLCREGFPGGFAQIFEVRMKDVHAQNDSSCFRLKQANAR